MTDRVLADLKAMVFSPGRRLNHAVRVICRPIFHVSSRPTILHPERVLPVNLYRPGRKDAADGEGPVKTGGGGPGGGAGGAGGCLLAINHHHPLDIPALFYATPRLIDFVSIAEVMGVKGLGAFYRQFDTITLNRGTVDPAAIRTIVARLRAGRAVGFFPEAKITSPQESVTAGGGASSGAWPHCPVGGGAGLAGGGAGFPAIHETYGLVTTTADTICRGIRRALADTGGHAGSRIAARIRSTVAGVDPAIDRRTSDRGIRRITDQEKARGLNPRASLYLLKRTVSLFIQAQSF